MGFNRLIVSNARAAVKYKILRNAAKQQQNVIQNPMQKIGPTINCNAALNQI